MRTIFLLGLAAGSLLLAGRATSAELPLAAPTDPAGRAAFAPAPDPKLDYGLPAATDTRVYTSSADRVPSEVDYRHVNGAYDAEGRWTGTWNGTYEAPDGGRYEGTYEGTVQGRPGVGYPPPPPGYDPYYGGGYDADMEKRCGRGGTATGAVVGGVVGGVIGNRVAGRGDRTVGTVIGGAAGAIAGAAIGNEADRKKCDDYWTRRGPPQGGYYPGYSYGYPGGTTVYQQGGYGYGYGYGAGWYTPGVVVVTTIANGAPIVTERVVTETRTVYEKVPVRKRYAAKKKWKPKATPRCAC